MMKIALVLAFHFICSSLHAQDMKGLKSESVEIDQTLKRILEEDKTDERKYIPGQFVCYNFAQTFYLQRSSLVESLEPFDLDGIASEWGVIIQRLEETEKLPIYTVTLNDTQGKFSHMINAVLLDQEHPEKMESYIFIEPQSDAVMLTGKDVYDRYRSYYDKTEAHEPLRMDIGRFDSYKSNGTIYQSWGKRLYTFEL